MAEVTAAFSVLHSENFCTAHITEMSIDTVPSPSQKNLQDFTNLHKFAI